MRNKIFIRGQAVLLSFVFLSMALLGSVKVSASTAFTGMRNISSVELVKDMRLGWNLGNTLDAIGGETNWGNPKTTKAMIDKVKEMGFNTVRFPVTWEGHVGTGPAYTIDQTWLNRVEEVVNYALENNMYAILNLHHENSWLKPTFANEEQSKAKLTKIWEQVANRFKTYGDYLIFETMNEPRIEGSPNEWSGGSSENRTVINRFNLAAVNTIRGTGGNNASRHIMIPGHAAAALDVVLNDLVIPNNDSRIIISIHNYSPYYFAMDVNGTASWGTASDKSSLAAEFDALYNRYVKNGRAVVIGEFGTINKSNEAARIAHAEFFAKETRARGITPVWWDNGYSEAKKSDSYALLNRNALTWFFPEIAKALVRGAGGSSNTPTPTKVPTSTPTKVPTSTPTSTQRPATATPVPNTPTSVPTPGDSVPEDINGDYAINMSDIMVIASHFNATVSGTNYDKKCDLNNDGAINMNDIMIVAAKFNTVITPSSVIYQAEGGIISLGVSETTNTGYTGSGYVNFDNVIGSYLEWTANVPKSGAYNLTIRYANGATNNRPMEIKVNGSVVRSSLDFNTTANWTTWRETIVTVNLNQGNNTVRMTSITAEGGPNVDYLQVSTSGTV